MSDSFAKVLIEVAAVVLLGAAGWFVWRARNQRWLTSAASNIGFAVLIAVGAFVVLKGERYTYLPDIGGKIASTHVPVVSTSPSHDGGSVAAGRDKDGWSEYLSDLEAERKAVERANRRHVGSGGKTESPLGPDFDLKSGTGSAHAPSGPVTARPLPQSPPPQSEQVQRARLADLAARQLGRTSVFVAWRDELPWGRQTPIKAVIASADRAEAKAEVADASGKTQAEEKIVAIGRKVRAELSGPNVEITKPEQTVRDVTNLENVTFEWLVKPTRPGRTTLTLRVFNQLITPDGPIELERPALEHQMSVKIGVLDWLTWQMDQTKGLVWVGGGALAVLTFAITKRSTLRRWWRRRHPPAPPPPTPAPPPGPPGP